MGKAIGRRFKTVVRKSAISGRGLFAGRTFTRGEVIIKARAKLKPPEMRYGAHMVVGEDGRAYQILNKARYINHARPPNSEYLHEDAVTALRQINAGEEITIDYGPAW